jgi:HEPN domain-containing protein
VTAAAERALKAYLFLQGHRAVIGHSILSLLKSCMAHDRSFKELEKIKRLDEV